MSETPKETRTTRRRAETRRRVIDAAFEVFTEHGIRDAPVELICERAGFTRGAFYSNFSTKEDLFLAVYDQQMAIRLDRMRAAVGEALRCFDPDADDLRGVMTRVALSFMEPLFSDESWFLLAAEFRAQVLRQPELRDAADAVNARFHEELAKITGSLLGRVGMRLAIPARDAMIVLVSLYETALERALMEGIDSPGANRFLTDALPRVMSSLVEPA
ncbi:helix-turn-helix transcriptional regulator [Amycolatopsis acidicola]|uniref:Helix-turn-helix transcriptional regulator n=1 Tax=Amycolatopsis acidicola TaxID=2596893 RepID=A0A5N0V2V4_9PSEU|nr:TetR/AcrR family transcriptional regulator [Amycolatopsis acidicola]KAA9160777.1 helix-turn-helix transcriptional regulator [Amycolatopsis acidicola]